MGSVATTQLRTSRTMRNAFVDLATTNYTSANALAPIAQFTDPGMLSMSSVREAVTIEVECDKLMSKCVMEVKAKQARGDVAGAEECMGKYMFEISVKYPSYLGGGRFRMKFKACCFQCGLKQSRAARFALRQVRAH